MQTQRDSTWNVTRDVSSRAKIQSDSLCARNHTCSAGSDVRNLLSSLRKSHHFAGPLKSSFQSSWFGAKKGMNLVRLAATCHSCTSTPMTLCDRFFCQKVCLITPWQGLCDWTARRPCCHSLDTAQRELCTAGRVISPVACPIHSMFSAFGR